MSEPNSERREVKYDSAPSVASQDSKQVGNTQPSDQKKDEKMTKRDALHYHYFGRRGLPVQTKATMHSWKKHLPFVKPVKTTWNVQLSAYNLLRLLYGYEPLEMPDKWFIYADGPNRSGKIVINFFRSWYGKKIAELLIRLKGNVEDGFGLWAGDIVELTFEGDEEEAERIADTSTGKDESDLLKIIGDKEEGAALDDRVAGIAELDISSDIDADNIPKGKQPENNALDTISLEPQSLEPRNAFRHDRQDGDEKQEELDSESEDEKGENWTKFLVLTACSWVLGIDLGIANPEPRRWTRLASQPAEMVPKRRTVYIGTTMPEETVEMLLRMGPGATITLG